MHIFHKWTRWVEIDSGEAKLTYWSGSRKDKYAYLLERECETCGDKDSKIVVSKVQAGE